MNNAVIDIGATAKFVFVRAPTMYRMVRVELERLVTESAKQTEEIEA